MKILSISIAAYNVDMYLKQTLDTLVASEFLDDLEILIVDDGSIDNTMKIGEYYQSRYPKSIVYIGKTNGGHGSTINKGLELATGKYFKVIDGDDYVDTLAFDSFVKKIKVTDIDLAIANYCAVDNMGNRTERPFFNRLTSDVRYKFSKAYDTRAFGLSTITIKTDLLKNSGMQITENCFYVDIEFVIWSLYLADEFIYWNDIVYMYRKVGTGSVSKENMLKNVDMQKKVSLSLAVMYKAMTGVTRAKDSIIVDRIGQSVGATMRSYLLLESSTEAKIKIIELDKELDKVSRELYEKLGKNIFIQVIRFGRYSLIPYIKTAYRMWLKE